jgi:hypothetical protein
VSYYIVRNVLPLAAGGYLEALNSQPAPNLKEAQTFNEPCHRRLRQAAVTTSAFFSHFIYCH